MPAAGHGRIIFLADDDHDLRESLQDALEDAGYVVLPARSGTEALARMRGISMASLAIVDLNMPDMDGWELISTMRADQHLSTIPILVISSHGRESVTGVERFFRKPLVLTDLLRTVQELLPSPSH